MSFHYFTISLKKKSRKSLPTREGIGSNLNTEVVHLHLGQLLQGLDVPLPRVEVLEHVFLDVRQLHQRAGLVPERLNDERRQLHRVLDGVEARQATDPAGVR